MMLEFYRLWHNSTIKVVLGILATYCLVITYIGVSNYKEYRDETYEFQKCEKLRANLHPTYSQYAATGIRILWKWSPLNIFFNANGMKKTYATIDSSEIVEICDSRRWKTPETKFYNSFSDMLNIVGSLIFLILGYTAFRNLGYITFLNNKKQIFKLIYCRLSFLILYLLILFLMILLMPPILGIALSWDEVVTYLYYMLYCIIVLSVSHIIGVILFLLRELKKTLTLITIVCVLLFEISLSSIIDKKNQGMSVEKLNLKKISTLSKLETKVKIFFEKNPNLPFEQKKAFLKKFMDEYMESGFLENMKLEKLKMAELSDELLKREAISPLFPNVYMFYLSSEFTANGISCYTKFFRAVLSIRHGFIRYITNKRIGDGTTVIPFEIDYTYFQTPKIPQSFITGLILIIAYFFLLNAVVFFLSDKPIKKTFSKNELPSWTKKIESGKLNFKKFKDITQLFNVYTTFKSNNTSCLDKNCDFLLHFQSVPLKRIIIYLSRLKKFQPNMMIHLLSLFDINLDTPVNRENIIYIYVAFTLSEVSAVHVINDFLGSMPLSFYEKFECALKHVIDTGKTVLFLTLKSYKLKAEEKFLDNENLQVLNLNIHSLR